MADKRSIELFKKLKKLTTQRRVAEATNPEYGRFLLSLLTPTQYAELFPKWYWKSLPDVSGFRAALTKKTQDEQQSYFDSVNRRLSGADGIGRYEDNKGAASKTEMMKYAMDQLRREGVPAANLKAAAAHLVGQAYMESGLNPNLKHDNNTGYGIYGARLDRRDKMFGWLSQNGYANNSAEGQMRYMVHEAMNDGKYGVTRNVLMNARPETFESDSAAITANFERPAVNNYRAGAVKAAFGSYSGEDTGATAQPVAQQQNVPAPPVVQPQPVVGEVPRPVERTPNQPPATSEAEGGVAFMPPPPKREKKKKETATVNRSKKEDDSVDEVGPNTTAFAGGGKKKIKGSATITRLNKKHRGDTAVVRDSAGEEFTVNPEKENISVDNSGNVNVRPNRSQMPMEKLMAVVRRQESGSFEGNYTSDLKDPVQHPRKKGQRVDSASGAYQYNDRTWKGVLRDELNMPDILGKYPRAVTAPKEIQDMVTQKRFEGWRRKGYTDEEIILHHFTGNRQGKLAPGAQKGNPTPAQYRAAVESHKREYDKQYVNAPSVSPVKENARLEAQVSMMPQEQAPEAAPSTPQSQQQAEKPTETNLGDRVRQIAGLSVRAAAQQQQVPTDTKKTLSETPGSTDITRQPPPTIGPSKEAAESANISQKPKPAIMPVPKVDTGTIAPGPTTQMDLLRDEMRNGFETMAATPTQQEPPQARHVRANKPIVTEMPPDVQHQGMMSTLPDAAKDPYGGVPSLERAANRTGFDKERPWALGNKH